MRDGSVSVPWPAQSVNASPPTPRHTGDVEALPAGAQRQAVPLPLLGGAAAARLQGEGLCVAGRQARRHAALRDLHPALLRPWGK